MSSVSGSAQCASSTTASAGARSTRAPSTERASTRRSALPSAARSSAPAVSSISRSGCSGTGTESGSHAPARQLTRSCTRARSARTTAVLPIPASPATSTKHPRPPTASLTAPTSNPSSTSRSSSSTTGQIVNARTSAAPCWFDAGPIGASGAFDGYRRPGGLRGHLTDGDVGRARADAFGCTDEEPLEPAAAAVMPTTQHRAEPESNPYLGLPHRERCSRAEDVARRPCGSVDPSEARTNRPRALPPPAEMRRARSWAHGLRASRPG